MNKANMLGLMAAAMMPDMTNQISQSGGPSRVPFNWQRSKSKAAKRKIKQAKKARKRNR